MKRANKVEEHIVFEKFDYLNSVVTEVFEKADAICIKLATDYGRFTVYRYNSGLHELVEDDSNQSWATSKNLTYAACKIVDGYIEQSKGMA